MRCSGRAVCRVLSNSANGSPGSISSVCILRPTLFGPSKTRPTTTLDTSPNRPLDPTRRDSTDPGAVQCVQVVGLPRGKFTTQSITQRTATNESGHQFPAGRPFLTIARAVVTVPLSNPHTQVGVSLARLSPPPRRSRAVLAAHGGKSPQAFTKAFLGCLKTVAAEFAASGRASCHTFRHPTPQQLESARK